MAKKAKQPKLSFELVGTGMVLEFSKVACQPSDIEFIYMDQMKDQSWRLLYTAGIIPDLTLLEEIRIERIGEQRFLDLVGLGTRVELTVATGLKFKVPCLGTIQFDQLADKTWRVNYIQTELLKDLTEVGSFKLLRGVAA